MIIYTLFICLYNSFHWQGGTVATLEYICDEFELNCHLPFLDSQVIRFSLKCLKVGEEALI